MIKVAPKDRLIVIERATVTTDDYGGEVTAWTALAEVAASYRPGTAQERREAAQETATETATFTVYHNEFTASATAKDRISFNGSYWDIVSNVARGLNTEREFTATRSA